MKKVYVAALVLGGVLLIARKAGAVYKSAEVVRVLEFSDLVDLYARMYGVPASRVYAIAAYESSGDPRAGGPTNDRGLMQITPIGLAEVNRIYSLGFTFDEMWDPAKNIRVGAALLSIYYRQYGSIDMATRAYNVGPNGLKKNPLAGLVYLARIKKVEATYLSITKTA